MYAKENKEANMCYRIIKIFKDIWARSQKW